MEKKYLIPDKEIRTEIIIKKSRFITTVTHTDSEEKAKEFIQRIRHEFTDATHHCWAFNAGPPADTARIGLSDDGEPHGTAGKPILNILLHSGLGEISAVVTRYYGGTKLGTGGLVRAYSGAVKESLIHLKTTEKRDLERYKIKMDYSYLTPARQLLESYNGLLEEEQFTENVTLYVRLPKDHIREIGIRLSDLSAGRIRIAKTGT